MEKILTKHSVNKYDAIIQNNMMSCEILGCSKEYSEYLFNTSLIMDNMIINHIEFIYSNRINKLNKVLILPKLSIEPTQIGGLNELRTIL